MASVAELSIERKYKMYEDSVQNPECDIDFVISEYQKCFGRKPHTLREDFAGTGFMACEWVKRSKDNHAWAVDLDNEPISYGLKNHYVTLSDEEKTRMKYLESNVLSDLGFKTDTVVAFNFSYYIFKQRKELLEYFSKVYASLNEQGMLYLDLFGGTEAYAPQIEETEHEYFSYFWDLEMFNPLNSECLYYIHFEDHKEGIRYNQVFTYDWRMWTPRELIEVLQEAGFKEVKTYWEGEDGLGGGDGNFFETQTASGCNSWVTYIVAVK